MMETLQMLSTLYFNIGVFLFLFTMTLFAAWYAPKLSHNMLHIVRKTSLQPIAISVHGFELLLIDDLGSMILGGFIVIPLIILTLSTFWLVAVIFLLTLFFNFIALILKK